MELTYMREFVHLADVGNFMSAAEDLFVSQSSLSKHIKVLEEELGALLFDRTTRKVKLTSIGHIFLKYAREIVLLQHECLHTLRNIINNQHATVTVGVLPTMAQYNITDIIAKFKMNTESLKINLITGDTLDIKKMLEAGSVELAFIRETGETEDFDRIHYHSDHLVAVVPINHKLSKNTEISIKQLRDEDLVLLSGTTWLYELCREQCKNAGFDMKILFTGHQLDNIADFVTKGLGIALLMEGQTKYIKNPNVAVIKIVPEILTGLNLCWKKGINLSYPAKHFMRCLNIVRQTPIIR
jgi:DNA-binding transcriptional LysR family regulator